MLSEYAKNKCFDSIICPILSRFRPGERTERRLNLALPCSMDRFDTLHPTVRVRGYDCLVVLSVPSVSMLTGHEQQGFAQIISWCYIRRTI